MMTRITPIEITAAGMDAETVIPTRSPRYALAAPNTIARMTPMITAVSYTHLDEDKVDYKIISTDSSTGDKYESDYKQNKADWDSSFFSNSSTVSSDTQNSSGENVDAIAFESDSSSLKYTGFETMPYDSSSTDTLGVVKFNFSNKNDSPVDAASQYSIKAYQNGIELEWYDGTGNAACDNTYKTILKDASLEVGFAFMLQDTQSPITVYALSLIHISGSLSYSISPPSSL